MYEATILVLGTCDSKLEETLYLRDQILRLETHQVRVMDVGRYPSIHGVITYRPHQILSEYNSETHEPAKDVESLSRADYSTYIAAAGTHFVKKLQSFNLIHGIVAAGGSSGCSICSAIMRDALPIGFPKLLVSTMASGDVSPYIDNVDITMMYSVIDIAGLNFLSRQILSNAAGAINGMVFAEYVFEQRITASPVPSSESDESKQWHAPRVGITMFGVTTLGVDAIRSLLTKKHGFEVLVFHATGSGGRAMERLCHEGVLDGIIDLTTSEIADELVGGVLTAGPHRMEAPVRRGIPYVVSAGGCDMVNFGPRDTVPEKWTGEEGGGGRKLYEHNASVTLMRTTKEENRRIGDYMVDKLRSAKDKGIIKVVLPTEAISMLAGKGGEYEDREADEELFVTIEEGLKDTGIEVLRYKSGINDPVFAESVVDVFVQLMGDRAPQQQGSR